MMLKTVLLRNPSEKPLTKEERLFSLAYFVDGLTQT